MDARVTRPRRTQGRLFATLALAAVAATVLTTVGAPVASALSRTTVPAALPMASATIADATYQPTDPARVMAGTRMGPATTTTLTLPNVPSGATSVQLNVTATAVSQTTYVSACATGTPTATCAATSALNPSPRTDTAASVLVALGGSNGNQVTFYNNAGTITLIADLEGYYVTGNGGAGFLAQSPERAMDRSFGAKQSATLTLPDVPDGATAVAVNVTASGTTAPSYASVCPAGQALSTCTRTSTLNPVVGRDVANFAVVRLGGSGADGLTVYNNAGVVRLIVDVLGYFVPLSASADASLYRPVSPTRVMNFQAMSAGSSYTLTVPSAPTGASAVVMNLTATRTSAVSYVSACPKGTAVTTCATTSTSNPVPGIDTANAVMLKLGGTSSNQVVVYNNRGTTSLIGDVVGYFVKQGSPPAPAPVPPVTPPPPPATPGVPSATNTGVPAGTPLMPYYGTMVVTTPGTVIDGMDIYGFVLVRAANVTIRNSIVRGDGPGSYNTGLINTTHASAANVLIEDVTLVPQSPSIWISGVLGHDFTARRVHAYNVVDGFNVYNQYASTANVRIESSYVHDLSYFSPDPNHSDNKTHNDVIQVQGGSNIVITGNRLSAWLSTSAGTQNYSDAHAGFGVVVTPNVSPVTNSLISGNWIDGGIVPIKLQTSTKFGAMTFGTVSGNQITKNYAADVAILTSPNLAVSIVGNAYPDGTPVVVRNNG